MAPRHDADVETSLISAFIGAQVGEMQLAVAGRLARMNAPGMNSPDLNSPDLNSPDLNSPDLGSSISQLVNAADQSANNLANVAAGIGTNVDMVC